MTDSDSARAVVPRPPAAHGGRVARSGSKAAAKPNKYYPPRQARRRGVRRRKVAR